MSVMRVHKTANYTVMSNTHFKEKSMSLKAKGLLSLMLSLPDDWNYSVSGLVRLSKDGKDGVMSALGELEEFGYLVRHRITNSKGQFSGIEYNIYEQPQRGEPIADKPILDKPKAAGADAENQPQLNTKELNTDNKVLNELNKKKDKGEIPIDTYYDILATKVVNEELRNLYVDYIEMRRNIGAPISKRGLSMLIDRCERIANFSLPLQKILLEAAIINNWKNVYMPNDSDLTEAKRETLKRLREVYDR